MFPFIPHSRCLGKERLNEEQQHCDQQTIQTCCLGNGLSEQHGRSNVGLSARIPSYCSRSVTGSNTLAYTGADTCDNRKARAYR